MRLALAPHVRLAVLGDDVVFLDIRADAYLCAPGARARLRPTEDRAAIDPADAESRTAVLSAGLAYAGRPSPRHRLSPPTRDVPDLPARSVSRLDLMRLAGAVFDLLVHYRGRTFGEILEVAAAGAAPDDHDEARVVRLAGVFLQAAPWLPIPDKCLARSFVLLRFLQRSGASARWVFGVRTWPFGAHCWLQVGDLVLDDLAERLRPYEPIHGVN